MNVYFSANNYEELIVLPITPIIEEVIQDNQDTEFISVLGTLNVVGALGLKTFSMHSFFPSKPIPSMVRGSVAEPKTYINFFEKWRDKGYPLRLIITDKGETIINIACRYNFSYALNSKNGDINYTLDIKEYRFVEDFIK